MAEIVGSDKIINYISKYHFRKIKISRGSDVVYTDSVKTNGEESLLLNKLENWINDFIDPENYKEYKLELFGTNKEDPDVKNLTPVIKISVQFNSKDVSNNRIMGYSNNYDLKEYTALAVENAKLNAQLSRLEEKLNDVITEKEVVEPDPSIGSRIGEILLDRADDIINLLLMKFAGNNNNVNTGMAGFKESIEEETVDVNNWDNEILDVADQFKQINPDILDDLKKLLLLAQTNKPLFDMLIKQLRNM